MGTAPDHKGENCDIYVFGNGEWQLKATHTISSSSGSFSGVITVLSGLGRYYVLKVILVSGGTTYEKKFKVFIDSTPSTTPPSRPNNWSWESTVLQNEAVPVYQVGANDYEAEYLTASEWNGFADRIGAFGDYLGMVVEQRDMDAMMVTAGDPMLYSTIEKARSIIDLFDPPISVPTASSVGRSITAYLVNGLKNSLNSIE